VALGEAAASQAEQRRRELKQRIEEAADEGEKRRLVGQLDQFEKQCRDRLAQENEAQQKRLKEAVEARRRKKKKANDELNGKRLERMTAGTGAALDGLLDTDEARAAESGKRLVQEVDREFSSREAVQATQDYLDKTNEQELLDLMNAIFAEKTKVLKKLVYELLAQKQGEYEQIRAEFEPQYAFLKEKKAKGLIAGEDYKKALEKLSEEESERKMDVEIEFNEKEQEL